MDPRKLDRYGAIVLCGGASSRMGRDKASLPFGPSESLLGHTVNILRQVVRPANILVVAGYQQSLPALPPEVPVVHERQAGEGPLRALVEGLSFLPARVDAVIACGCDAPLLQTGFIKHLFELLSPDVDAVVPVDENGWHPLAAAYGARSHGLWSALRDGERSLHRALQSKHLTARTVHVSQLRGDDPELLSLVNCNTPQQYQWALARAYPESSP